MRTLTPAYAAVFLLVGLGSAFPALATGTGQRQLGDAANAFHAFKFTCPAGTISARAKVADITPPPNARALMRVKLFKDGDTANAEDVAPPPSGEGSASSPSPNAELAKGPGAYRAFFYKTAAEREDYIGTVDCKTFSGDHDPVLTKIQ